jgi:D-alanyl-D-alanine carboxypeptidase
MRCFIFIAVIGLSLAGCASPPSSALDYCTASSAYVGPALRAPIEVNKFPSATINTQRKMGTEQSEALKTMFAEMVENQTDADNAAIAIWHPERGFWYSTYGAQANKPFWWASVAKMTTATIILQLFDEQKLSLDDKLSLWLPQFPNAELITIQDLLTHTSGVFDFNTDKKFRERQGIKTIEEIIKVSAQYGTDYCPGSDWFYNNTGYVLLGYLAELIEGKSLGEIVEDRIAAPLALSNFGVIRPTDPPGSIVAPEGADAPTVSGVGSLYGAGALKATPQDMMVFLSAFLEGKLIAETNRNQAFEKLYPMFEQPMNYGQGVMVFDVPDPDRPAVWLGHSGGSANAKGLVVYDVEREAYVAVVLNKQASAEAIANTLLKFLD